MGPPLRGPFLCALPRPRTRTRLATLLRCMRRLLLSLLLATPAAGDPLIVAVVPDLSGAGPGDEAVALAATEPVDVTGWALTDTEGTWSLPAGTVLGPEPAWFVGAAGAWAQHGGPAPAAVFGSALRLANGGDDVHLLDPSGRTVDSFLYGDEATSAWGELGVQSPDLVYRRVELQGRWQDSDSAADWRTPRLHRVGESRLDRPVFLAERVTLHASPDSSFGVLAGLLEGAQRRVHLHVYELRSQVLVDALVDAAPRVDVQVLVESRPVGQEAFERAETAAALQRVEQAGGQAWLAGNGRYRYHHLKVLVADDAVAVQSENWVPAGVPADPSWGNRGWGVVVHGAGIADWFAAWMEADREAWDTARFDLAAYDPFHETPPRFATATGGHRGIPAMDVPGPVRVRPVVSPDHTHDPAADPVMLAAGAASRLWLQQLDISTGGANALGWHGPDGMREALRAAGRGGVDSRVMAAAPFRFDDTGNAEAMAALPADGVATCTFAVPDLVLHNKGVVADDAVYVGSMNGNHHSRSQNREAGLLIEDARVAAYFAALFEDDWRHCPRWPGAQAAAPVPTLLLAGIVAATLLCSRWSPSPPSPSSSSP